MESLPDELLLATFGMIPSTDRVRLLGVSRRLRALALDHSLWNDASDLTLPLVCVLGEATRNLPEDATARFGLDVFFFGDDQELLERLGPILPAVSRLCRSLSFHQLRQEPLESVLHAFSTCTRDLELNIDHCLHDEKLISESVSKVPGLRHLRWIEASRFDFNTDSFDEFDVPELTWTNAIQVIHQTLRLPQPLTSLRLRSEQPNMSMRVAFPVSGLPYAATLRSLELNFRAVPEEDGLFTMVRFPSLTRLWMDFPRTERELFGSGGANAGPPPPGLNALSLRIENSADEPRLAYPHLTELRLMDYCAEPTPLCIPSRELCPVLTRLEYDVAATTSAFQWSASTAAPFFRTHPGLVELTARGKQPPRGVVLPLEEDGVRLVSSQLVYGEWTAEGMTYLFRRAET